MTVEGIKKIIPHRDPFLLIDRISDLVPLESAIGYKDVTGHEDFFKGHFPGQPVMPGVLVLEAMAQVGAVIVLAHDKYKGKLVYFTGADKVKFRKKVLPTDTLKIVCNVIKLRGSFGVGKAEAYVDGELVCEATIKFAIN